MTILPIKAVTPTCYGVGCARHARCARYGAVEANAGAHTIGTCLAGGDGVVSTPLYLENGQEWASFEQGREARLQTRGAP